MPKSKKISIVGAGNVGATIAYLASVEGIAGEIALVDIAKEKAEGEIMDLSDATPYLPNLRYFTGEYDVTKDSDIVIVTAGIGRKPGMTRIELANTNISIMNKLMPELVKYSPNASYIIVSNPADICSYATLKTTGLSENQIIGSGTVLDSSRLRTRIGKRLGINPKDVNAYVIGEHGDTSVVPWSLCNIFGMNILDFAKLNGKEEEINFESLKKLESDMRRGGGSVIARKGATFYAISISTIEIAKAVLMDTKRVMSVSTMLNGEYGIDDVFLSIPCVVGRRGIESKLKVEMTDDELAKLQHSGDALKEVIKGIKF